MTTVACKSKERSILFSASMVRAILDGRKTMTRRVAKTYASPASCTGWFVQLNGDRSIETDERAAPYCPHGKPGDRLWARETFNADWCDRVIYKADDPTNKGARKAGYSHEPKWRPSIHMPRWASRITLEITGVKVERLQDIDLEDARAEGIPEYGHEFRDGLSEEALDIWRNSSTVENFARIWDSIDGRRPGCEWASDPWVWAITFCRLEAAS